MVVVLILCIVTLALVVACTVLVATLHHINLKLASKRIESETADPQSAAETAAVLAESEKNSENGRTLPD